MVLTKRLVAVSVLLSAPLLAAATPALPAATAAAASSAAANASTLYREAVATTRSWSVHYDSSSTESKQTIVVSGDAGPASGSQTVVMGTGSIMILVIGGITYVKGNAGGLQNLAGFSVSQAGDAAGQWIEFATNNSAFAQVVAGVRSSDVASQLLLRGPLTLGRPEALDGYAVDAIEGTQTFAHKSVHVVLFVRAGGIPRPSGRGLPEHQGTAHRDRARDLLQLGRARAAAGAAGHRLHRPRQRRMTPPRGGAEPTSRPGRARMFPSPPGRAGATRAAEPASPGE